MWIFGYGSLMWDGWESDRACLRRTIAVLPRYARIFNKASVYNWGTASDPGPTLNLVASDGSCEGMAFEFDEAARADIVTYLNKREGAGFVLKEMTVVLRGGGGVEAQVPLYQGHDTIPSKGTVEIAAMALKAKGVRGSCVAYIEGIAEQLRKLGIADPAVDDLHRALLAMR